MVSDTLKRSHSFAAIAPTPEGYSHPISKTQRTVILKKTLELLWKCESVLLVEYIEVVVPMMYSISVSILYFLPSAKYHLGMAEMTIKQLVLTVSSILVYSVLKFSSLLYIHMILQWKFKLSALHQLAFVLKGEQNIARGVCLSWVVVVLGFTLVHYGKPGVWFPNALIRLLICDLNSELGNDLTLEFKWVREAKHGGG